MRVNYDNIWQERTGSGYLRALVRQYNDRHGSNEFPETKEQCMQMLFDRVELYAENGYTSYTHSWSSLNLPRHYLLEEIRDLAREVFVGCTVSFTTTDVLSASSSSSNPPVIERTHELTISWEDEETAATIG
jgi:hypothetical protein